MPRDIPVSNGSLLVNFDKDYQVRDIYWPHVGMKNHTNGHQCRLGVWIDGMFRWLDDHKWQRSLKYQMDTLVTDVRLSHPDLQLELEVNDLVDFHENIFIRKLLVRDLAGKKRQVRIFFAYDFYLDGTEIGDSAYYEPERKAIFHYKGKTWIIVNGAKQDDCGIIDIGIDQWAIGTKNINGLEGAWRDAEDGDLSGNSVAQGSVDSVSSLHLSLEAKGQGTLWHWLGIGEDFSRVATINRRLREKGPDAYLCRTRDYWRLWANKESESFTDLSKNVCELCRRSLLVLRTQIDNNGAILAANDHDYTAFSRDTYSYMWPRDGALVAAALIDVGYSEISRRFFTFCHDVITEEGYLLHKYNPDGSLASSWHGWHHSGGKQLPIQEDETALVLWAFWLHFDKFRDVEFIKPHYRGLVTRAGNWMIGFRDDKTGLPHPSWDLWEERYGVHAWTVGAVWAGLIAAANFAEAFGQTYLAKSYRKNAKSIKAACGKYLWSKENNRFMRMVSFDQNNTMQVDNTMDASLVGLWYFGMYAADDPKIIATMQAIRERLWVKTDVGGLARYENDYYHQVSHDIDKVPGNPWFISSLWLAQWIIKKAKSLDEINEARSIIQWATDRALPSGIMAEQIDPYSNEPLSVSPLTWSHATLVMTVRQLMGKRKELNL